jgi:hypothetical protein
MIFIDYFSPALSRLDEPSHIDKRATIGEGTLPPRSTQ